MKNFINRWKDKGDEKSDTHTFWLDLLHTVFNLENPGELIEFEKRVGLKHVSYIDAYIPSTKILIEQRRSISSSSRSVWRKIFNSFWASEALFRLAACFTAREVDYSL